MTAQLTPANEGLERSRCRVWVFLNTSIMAANDRDTYLVIGPPGPSIAEFGEAKDSLVRIQKRHAGH
jgi:hypothetical protein